MSLSSLISQLTSSPVEKKYHHQDNTGRKSEDRHKESVEKWRKLFKQHGILSTPQIAVMLDLSAGGVASLASKMRKRDLIEEVENPNPNESLKKLGRSPKFWKWIENDEMQSMQETAH